MPAGFDGVFSWPAGSTVYNLQLRADGTYLCRTATCDTQNDSTGTWTGVSGGVATLLEGTDAGAFIVRDGGELIVDGRLVESFIGPGNPWLPGGACFTSCDGGVSPCVPQGFSSDSGTCP